MGHMPLRKRRTCQRRRRPGDERRCARGERGQAGRKRRQAVSSGAVAAMAQAVRRCDAAPDEDDSGVGGAEAEAALRLLLRCERTRKAAVPDANDDEEVELDDLAETMHRPCYGLESA